MQWPLHASRRLQDVEAWNQETRTGYPDGFWGKVHALPCAIVQELERVNQHAREHEWTFPPRAVSAVVRVAAELSAAST